MMWSKTPGFRTLCRFVLFFFLFSLLPPANLGMPSPQSFAGRTAGTEHWLLDLWRWILAFGPTPAYAQDALLASTPDANTSDPFIVQKAAELGHDPQRIFAFVRDEIGYESYKGSLRGARGTLWSKAGNALDKASLLIALLRASGVPARYAQGTLGDADTKTLIISMFDPKLMAHAVGFIPERFDRADPVNDPALLTEARDHWWVEIEDGTLLDPSFRNAVIGEARGVKTAVHTEVPDSLRHKVTIRLKTEFHNVLSRFTERISLEQTFTTVTVYGKPLTIGHFINVHEDTGLFGIGQKTFTYSPYIQIEDNDASIENNQLIRGTDYQEFFSNLLPLANTILTRLTLEMAVQAPGQAADIRVRDLLDRVGFAARNGLAEPGSVNADQPAFTALDLITVYITPGFVVRELIPPLQEALRTLGQEATQLTPQVETLAMSDPTLLTSADQALLKRYTETQRAILVAGGSIVAAAYLLDSDFYTRRELARQLTHAYYDTPRLTLYQSHVELIGEEARLQVGLDLRRNHIRAVPYPGQNAIQRFGFNMIKGRWDSVVEHEIIELLLANSLPEARRIISPIAVLQATKAQDIPLVKLVSEADIPTRLETLAISAEAKARVAESLRAERQVNVPARMVELNGSQAIGWWEIDLTTGEVISVSEDGGRQAIAQIIDYAIVLSLVIGMGFAALTFLDDDNRSTYYDNPVLNTLASLLALLDSPSHQARVEEINNATTQVDPCVSITQNTCLQQRVLSADTGTIGAAAGSIIDFAGTDIEVITLLAPGSQEFSGEVVAGAGLQLETVPEQAFVVKTGESQIPSGFRARITNTGVDGDFTLEGAPPPGWNLLIARQESHIPAGTTGEVSVFLQPQEGISLPTPGTLLPFSITVRRSDNSTASLTQNITFRVPEVSGLRIKANPEFLPVTSDNPAQASITFTNVGNIANTVHLHLEVPTGVSISGINSPLALAPGESITHVVTFTAQGLPLNSDLLARIVAEFGASGELQKEQSLRLYIAAPGALAALNAANAAQTIGRPGLRSALEALGQTLSGLLQDVNNTRLQSRAVALLDSLIAQLNAPVLTPFISNLTAAKNAITSGAPASIQQALNDLSGIMANLGNTLSSAAAFPFEVALQPNSAVALLQTPTHFALALQNTGEQTITYNLTLSPLPPGVTGELNRTSVTLAPGEAIPRDGGPNVEVTLTPSAQELRAFDFAVTVSVAGSPNITRTVQGAFTVRNELVEVVAVEASPAFTDPGGQVNISTRLLNAVNQTRRAQVSYTVKNPAGTVVFTSAPQEAELTVLSSLSTISLGALNTTGFALGDHTITVTVADLNGQPIPGAVGQGSLLIGSPLAASMAVAPQTLPPGNGTVTTTLQLDSHLDFPAPQIELLGLVDTAAVAASVAVNGNLVYVCGTEDITIVDISDRRNPQIVSTFADDLITNANSSLCRIMDGHLVVMWQEQLTVVRLPMLVFNLENPTQPVLVSNTSVDRRFLSSLFIQGNTAFATTTGFIFNALLKTVSFQFGDFLSFDLSNLASPRLADVLINTDGAPNGGRSPVWQGVPINAQLALVAASTSTLFRTEEGVGRVLVVDISNPNNLAVVRELQIPGTVHIVGVGIQGNLALAVGKTRGIRNPGIPDFDILGDLVLISLDLTDPRAPRVLGTLTAAPDSPGGGQVVPLGNGFFAVSGATISGQSVLMVVNANDPQNLTFTTLPVPERLRESAVMGNTLLTTSAAGLGVYNIGSLFGTRVTARVQVPKNTGVNLIPASLTIAPTDMITGSDFDTLVWERLLSAAHPGETISWQSTVTALQPGEAREVALGATIDFTVPSGDSGQIKLPPLFVVSEQILALQPASRTARPGEATTFTLTVQNPTASAVTYALSVHGVPQSWVNLTPSANVPAQGQTALTLTLQSDPLASVGENGFVVTAQANTGAIGAVHGTLLLAGAPVGGGSGDIGQDVASAARGVVLGLTPGQATAGQGTSATYAVRVTNTGNVTDSYTLSATLSAGLNGSFGQQVVEVPPGLDNFRDVPFTVTPAPGTAVGNQSFAVTAVSIASASVRAQVTGTIVVSNNGVQVAFTTPSGVPGSTFSVRVTNTGQIQDTFGLALGGPLAPFATLSTPTTSLAPGASQIVTVTLPAVHFAFPGTLDLAVVATSQGNTAVQNRAMADVAVTATQSVTATFAPEAMELPAPGPATFLLLVDNTGNTEDAYTAAITGLTGPITARLTGLDGQPAQTIPVFRLPGLATGAILLNANMLAPGVGTVTVSVTSLNQAGVQASDLVTLRTALANQAPVANAGPDQTVPFGQTVQLNGNASTDPDHGPAPLQFAWHFGQKPAGSQLTDSDLHGAATALVSFMPDVRGDFVLTLSVSDGAQTVTDDVRITVLNNHPVAIAGPDRNVKTGQPVRLDGSNSFDPDGDLIAYAWSLQAKPAKSKLTDAAIKDRTLPNPSVIPDIDGEYIFRLVVDDGQEDSPPDFVVLTVHKKNVPPNADAGDDQNALVGDMVLLDGRASDDPDNGPGALTFLWTFASKPPASHLQARDIADATHAQAHFVPDAPGTYVLRLLVSESCKRDDDDKNHDRHDDHGRDRHDDDQECDDDDKERGNDTDEVVMTVSAPNVPPNARAGAAQTLPLHQVVPLDGSASEDPDNGPAALSFTWHFVSVAEGSSLTNADIDDAHTATPHFTPDVIGSYVMRLQVSDGAASAFDNVLVTVLPPNQPPVCAQAKAQPARLWPPNHKLVPVTIEGITDPDQHPVTLTVTQVRQDEPVNSHGDGDTSPDAVLQGRTILLRAERAGSGNGRVYQVTFTAQDNFGGSCMGTVTVCVPHSQQDRACGDDGLQYDATKP